MTTTQPPIHTGPRRWCPHCKQQTPTHHGVFISHSRKNKPCPGSGQRPDALNTPRAENAQ
jgi:hypothetical protein